MCKIDEVGFAEPKFADASTGAFDIIIHGSSIDDPNQSDWWRGEMSGEYGKGNFATMTQAEITMQTLRKVGFEGDDLSTLEEQLMGREVPFHVKARDHEGKAYYDVKYIGESGNAPKKIDLATMQSRLSTLFGSGHQAQAPAPAPVKKAAPAGNPFAKQPGAAAAPKAGRGKLPF